MQTYKMTFAAASALGSLAAAFEIPIDDGDEPQPFSAGSQCCSVDVTTNVEGSGTLRLMLASVDGPGGPGDGVTRVIDLYFNSTGGRRTSSDGTTGSYNAIVTYRSTSADATPGTVLGNKVDLMGRGPVTTLTLPPSLAITDGDLVVRPVPASRPQRAKRRLFLSSILLTTVTSIDVYLTVGRII